MVGCYHTWFLVNGYYVATVYTMVCFCFFLCWVCSFVSLYMVFSMVYAMVFPVFVAGVGVGSMVSRLLILLVVVLVSGFLLSPVAWSQWTSGVLAVGCARPSVWAPVSGLFTFIVLSFVWTSASF